MPRGKTSSDSTKSRLDIGLPGCGLPLNHTVETLFGNALNPAGRDALLPLITLRERTMLSLMDQLSNKPDWGKKVFDETIASKWKAEALEASAAGVDITQRMVDWCIEELRYKAKILEKSGGAISVYPGDVVKSDTIVSKSLHDALKMAAAPLESVPDSLKDWHPGSDGKVLDLVHPSLFPLMYGRTRVLTEGLTTLDNFVDLCGSGHTLGSPPASEMSAPGFAWDANSNKFSGDFQWLPCEVDISGERARITSYINNLDPEQHRDLYQVIEQFISRAIPMWNMTLTPLRNRGYHYSRITYTACEYDLDPGRLPDTEGPQMEEGEDEDDYWERWHHWIEATRRVVLPEPGEFQPHPVPKRSRNEYFGLKAEELKPWKAVDLRRDFGHQGLQVIVKLANIHLTPDKPDYGGGTWHVEGQLNEHICATALYYYDSVNISTSLLAFRQQCDGEEASREIRYEQDAHDWLKIIFGAEQEGPTTQEIGAIETKEGRLITFPNILQHRVQPFSLADPSKPGHRKILALFLVDPHIRIISTANVPCQRRDWWRERVCENGPHMLTNLPLELQDQVYEQVEQFPISMEEQGDTA
ncbi:hypothetical protein BD779DRAFT_1673492 [Infundibulicybe gibba]|nr:hypothetical protein BD779DRAFT_1673492 [Infundibulicybe gibba]